MMNSAMKLALFATVILLCSLRVVAKDCEDLRTCTECTKAAADDGGKCDWCIETNSCTRRFSQACPKKYRVGGLPYNCPVKPQKFVHYNETFVKNFAFPFIAFAPETNRTNLEKILQCSVEGVKLVGTYLIPCNKKGTTGATCYGYTAVLPSQKAIVVSFRGSTTIPQLMNQARDFLSVPNSDFGPTKGKVFSYYNASFYGLWTAGMGEDVHKLAMKFPDYEVWSLGLSLGGAMASLASSHMVAVGVVPSQRIKMITFGQPRVGNVVHAAGHDRLVPYSFRVISAKDPIPHVGKGRAMHHRYEVWYPKGMKDGNTYRITNLAEDRAGFRSAAHHEAMDHLFYYGHDLMNYYKEFRCPQK